MIFAFENFGICSSVTFATHPSGEIRESSMRVHRLGFVLAATLFALMGKTVAQTIIHCVSDDGGKNYCPADTSQGARLVKQRSSELPCTKGSSWGYDDKGLWVDKGCDADFALGPETAPTTEGGGIVLTCSSDGGKKYCDANTGRGVRLVKQHGDTPCKQNSSWGYDGLGIWVDKGCSADFALGAAPQAPGSAGGAEGPSAKDATCLKAVGKQRADQLVKQCLQVSAATHPPCNAQNSCDLIVDEIRRSCALLGRDAPAFCGGYK
jgi:Protein of unknown function (DUF3011)